MAKVEDLINKLCPNGVEYKTLGDLGQFVSGLSGKSKTDFINGNKKFISYMNVFKNAEINIDTDEKVKIGENEKQNRVEYGDVIFTGSSENMDECAMSSVLTENTEEELYLNSFCFIFRLNNKEILLPSFSKYLFRSHEIRTQLIKTASGVTRFNVSKKKMENVKIPIPPIEVQSEIVRILDAFLKNTTELLAKLNEELVARQKQHEYYLDQLFMINDNTNKVKLIDVLFSLKTGLNPRKFFQLNTPDADGYYVTVRELGDRNVRYWESKDRVNQIGLNRINERSNLEINDVLFSGTGTIGRVSIIEEKPVNWNVKEGVYILKPNSKLINPVYLMYLMRSNYMKNIYSKYIVGSPVASVPMKDLKNVEFCLPSIEKQEKIVNELDKLEKTFSDLNLNLSYDIERTQKQYEYYMDKLLSFKEVEINE